jgi:hypothetical protein
MGSKDIDWMFSPYHPQSVIKSVAGKNWGLGVYVGGRDKNVVKN